MTDTIHVLEVANVAMAVALIGATHVLLRMRWWVSLLLLWHLSLVFLTNGLLFDASYMPDQFRYLAVARTVRAIGPRLSWSLLRNSVDAAGLLFGLFPLPFIKSIYSVSIINFMLYLIMFGFLYSHGALRGLSLWVMLLFPSLLLYSSVALREMFILLFMIFGIWFYTRGKLILSVALQLPLAVLKPQNLGIYCLSLVVMLLMAVLVPKLARRRIPLALAVVFVVALAAVMPFAYRYGLQGMNYYRHHFWLENMGLPRHTPVNPATQIVGVGSLIRETLVNIPYFLLKPLPWEAGNSLQLMQSVENILVAGLIVYLVIRALCQRVQTPVMTFMLVFLTVSLAVYGLTIWNYGTAARYRFPFVTLFLIFYSREYDLKVERIVGAARSRSRDRHIQDDLCARIRRRFGCHCD